MVISNRRADDRFSQVVAHSTKNSISMDASTEEVAATNLLKKPSTQKSISKSNQKSMNALHQNKPALMSTIPALKSQSKMRPG